MVEGRPVTDPVLRRLLPPCDWWILEERCPRCGAPPRVLRYASGEWGASVDFECPACAPRSPEPLHPARRAGRRP